LPGSNASRVDADQQAEAEKERAMISERTKVALRAAKGRGMQLGNPNVGKMNTEAAAARDAILRPILHQMWEMPYRDIAQELTNRNIPTPRGGDLWSAMTVMRVMSDCASLAEGRASALGGQSKRQLCVAGQWLSAIATRRINRRCFRLTARYSASGIP
jgi:hypothetical protein